MPSFDATPGVSASIGVAQWQAPMTVDELLEACDTALLRSKRQGKGRVTRAGPLAAPHPVTRAQRGRRSHPLRGVDALGGRYDRI